MPIYEYRCETCGHLHEALQKLSDPLLTDCPACEAVALKRLISRPSFRLKGAGWYETDFKSDKDKKRNLVESGGEAGKTSGDGGKDGGSDAGKSASKEGKEGGKESTRSDTKSADGKGEGAKAPATKKPGSEAA